MNTGAYDDRPNVVFRFNLQHYGHARGDFKNDRTEDDMWDILDRMLLQISDGHYPTLKRPSARNGGWKSAPWVSRVVQQIHSGVVKFTESGLFIFKPGFVMPLQIRFRGKATEETARFEGMSGSSKAKAVVPDLNSTTWSVGQDTIDSRRLQRLINEGRNICVDGRAGAGKSTFLCNVLFDLCLEKCGGENAAVMKCASTGIASLHIGGLTIHHGLGLKLGLGCPFERARKMPQSTRQRVKGLQVVIVDEGSMLSGKLLDFADVLMREVRGINSPMGGLQVIMIQNITQLGPVPPYKKIDVDVFDLRPHHFEKEEVVYDFESSVWGQLNFVYMKLESAHRHNGDAIFLRVLDKVASGIRDDEVGKFLEKLWDNEIQDGEGTMLFCKREDAAKYNLEKLALYGEGEEVVYASDDHRPHQASEDDALNWDRFFEEVMVGPVLNLRVGAHVICAKNLGNGVMNGSRGVVIGFKKEDTPGGSCSSLKSKGLNDAQVKAIMAKVHSGFLWPKVEFTDGDGNKVRVVLKPEAFDCPDHVGAPIVWRVQLPLLLAWGMTIHKAQGLTLSKVIVDVSTIFAFGQLYTALSRVRRSQDIALIGALNLQMIPLADPMVISWIARQHWLRYVNSA